MRKNIISAFYKYSRDFVARHERGAKACLGTVYAIGDGLIITIPPAENSFAKTLIDMNPDWHLLTAAYADRPLPALVSCLFVASAIVVGRGRFALGHAGMGLGAGILARDFYVHNELSAALSMLPAVAGGAFGAFYLPLERRFGNAKNWIVRETMGKPKRVAGVFFATTALPTTISSFFTHNWVLLAAGLNWFSGNVISMLLPPDDQSNAAALPGGQKSNRSGVNRRFDRR
jgi:uncharacterized membrane protein YgdD (TMEM256/DUF423 family)